MGCGSQVRIMDNPYKRKVLHRPEAHDKRDSNKLQHTRTLTPRQIKWAAESMRSGVMTISGCADHLDTTADRLREDLAMDFGADWRTREELDA